MPKKSEEDVPRSDYILTSVDQDHDFSPQYESLNHTKFYKERKGTKQELAQKWKDMVDAEMSAKRSRFYKNYQKIQSSSGIQEILEDVAGASKKASESIFENAIDEDELKRRFPDFINSDDPLTDEQKLKIHEAIQADGGVRRGLSFWRKFVFGRKVTALFRVKKSDLLRTEILDAVTKRIDMHPDLIKYRSRIRDIDDEVKLRESVQSICDNLFGYGRAVLVKLFNEDKLPVRLVPISSHQLGKVYLDGKTFEFIGVEYKELEKKNILLASDIIHFELNDNNVTPNSMYYGTSNVFPVLSMAETNLINRERNFPEIIRKRWAATLLIKTSTRSTARNQQIVDEVSNRAGGSVVIPDLVDAQNIQVDTELTSLINYMVEADKKILRDMELPMSAGGFLSSEITRAMAQAELHVWAESTLEDLREMMTDILVKQWYYPNLVRILETDVLEFGVETNFTPAPLFDPTFGEEQDPNDPSPTSGMEEQQNINKEQPDPKQKQQQAPDNAAGAGAAGGTEPAAPTEGGGGGGSGSSILEKLGFDLNAMEKLRKMKPKPEVLKEMIMQKLANIAFDITNELIMLTRDDLVSLTGEIKIPFETYLKFENIIFDTFLDRSAGVLGIKSAGVIDDDMALELMKLEQYIPRMRQVRLENEKKALAIAQGTGQDPMNPNQEEDENGNESANNQRPNNFNNNNNNQPNKNISNPTDAGVAAKNKVSGRLAQRLNRGKVSK